MIYKGSIPFSGYEIVFIAFYGFYKAGMQPLPDMPKFASGREIRSGRLPDLSRNLAICWSMVVEVEGVKGAY